MTEWLTTGQMIDKIKGWETAKVMNDPLGHLEGESIYNDGNRLLWIKRNRDFTINDATWGLRWEITPKPIKYISFEEAMKALKEGKTIKCYNSGLVPHEVKYNIKESTYLREIHIERIIEGKWSIEED